MSKKVNLVKLSENLTPKERAKLVITLRLKGIEDVKDFSIDELKKRRLPTQADITKVVRACPSEQVKEYNAYIELDHRVRKVLTDILFDLQHLDTLKGRISRFTYVLGIAPVTYHALEMVKRLPRLVTREKYKKGLKKAREIIRGEALILRGRYNLAEQEAYYRLVKEGKIDQEIIPDWLEGWLDFISDYGKTDKQMIDETANSVKYGLEQYLKHKQRTGKGGKFWKEYKKYEGLSKKGLREAVVKKKEKEDKKNNTNWLLRPTKKEYEIWQKTVKEERERILQAVKDGKLKWVKRKEKKFDQETKSFKWEEAEGVELGSYYDWKDRHQKYAGEGKEQGYNPLSEECIELRLIEGKGVVYVSDPSLTEREEEKEKFIAIVPPNQEIGFWGSPKMLEITKESLARYLEALLSVRTDKDRKKLLRGEDVVRLRLSAPQVEKALKGFVAKTQESIKGIRNKIALVEAVEEKHFDGMQIVSRDPKNPTGVMTSALTHIDELAKEHNEHLQGIARQFNSLDWGVWEYKFEGIKELLIDPNQQPDQKWVEEELTEIEEEIGINKLKNSLY